MKFDLKINLEMNIWYYIRHEKRCENEFGNEYLNLVYGGKIDLKVNLLLIK